MSTGDAVTAETSNRDEILNRLLSVTAGMLDCRYAAFSVIHEGQVHVIAGHRLANGIFHERHSPCARVIQNDRPCLVPDLNNHPSFHHHPWAMCMPRVRFYAAVPVRTAGGYCFGALSAMDTGDRREPSDWVRRLDDCAVVLTGMIEAYANPVLVSAQKLAVPKREFEQGLVHKIAAAPMESATFH